MRQANQLKKQMRCANDTQALHRGRMGWTCAAKPHHMLLLRIKAVAMTVTLPVFLIALAVFQIKHLVADFLLQTPYMFRNKGTYGHPGGLAHAGLHGVLSLPALWVLGAGPAAALMLVLAEMVAHYHIDWAKEQLGRRLGTTPEQARFWHLLGADQFLHQMTYLALLMAAVTLG